MKRFALTGGFATGKSTVGRMFEDLGLSRVDADVLVHQLMEPDTETWREIVATFGETILTSDRSISRRELGQIVFADSKQRKKLEAMIHPRVRKAMHAEEAALAQRGKTALLLEIPLLFEVGWDREEKWDAIIVVRCDPKIQIERAKQKFGLSPSAIETRLLAQLPIEAKVKRADFVIDNNHDQNQTRIQVEAIAKKLLATN